MPGIHRVPGMAWKVTEGSGRFWKGTQDLKNIGHRTKGRGARAAVGTGHTGDW